MGSSKMIIFLKNGQTLAFEDFYDFVSVATSIRFKYISETDNRRKSALFFIANIAGFSCDE